MYHEPSAVTSAKNEFEPVGLSFALTAPVEDQTRVVAPPEASDGEGAKELVVVVAGDGDC